MTRAQHHLQLLVPQRFYVTQQAARGDRHLWGGLSRFIPPPVAECFERVGGSRHEPVASWPGPGSDATAFDLAARVRSAWD
jgi:DNA helicase-2/ATP-dependent DNA helicase PcrA